MIGKARRLPGQNAARLGTHILMKRQVVEDLTRYPQGRKPGPGADGNQLDGGSDFPLSSLLRVVDASMAFAMASMS